MKRFLCYLLTAALAVVFMFSPAAVWTLRVVAPVHPVDDAFIRESAYVVCDGKRQTPQNYERLLKRGNDIAYVMGSSDFDHRCPEHPGELFPKVTKGFDMYLSGEAAAQSLNHAIELAAMGRSIAGKKAVLMVSPQWFAYGGQDKASFKANFSRPFWDGFVRQKGLSKELRSEIAQRVREILDGDTILSEKELREAAAGPEHYPVEDPPPFEHDWKGRVRMALDKVAGTPFEPIRRRIADLRVVREAATELGIKVQPGNPSGDQIPTLDEMDLPASVKSGAQKQASVADLPWKNLWKEAIYEGKQASTNNEWGLKNTFYSKQIAPVLEKYKGSKNGELEADSIEYYDLGLFLRVAKELGIDVLVVLSPVCGPWFDWQGIPREDWDHVSQNVEAWVRENGASLFDLSKQANDRYVLMETAHLGWLGWLQIDRAVIDFYYGKGLFAGTGCRVVRAPALGEEQPYPYDERGLYK